MDDPLDDEPEPLSEDFLYNPLRLQPPIPDDSSLETPESTSESSVYHSVAINVGNFQQGQAQSSQQSFPQILPKRTLLIQKQTPPEISNSTTPSPIDTFSPDSEPKTSKPTGRRRNNPCNQCRVRKVKCIRIPNEKQCKECKKKDQTCEFVDKTTSYAKVIENYNATCDNCTVTRTKCIRLPNSKSCLECSLKGLKMSCKFTKGKPQVQLLNTKEPVLDYNNYGEYQGLLTNSLHLQSLNNCIPVNPSCTGLMEKSSLRNVSTDLSTNFHEDILFRTFKDSEELVNLSTQHCDEVEKIIQPYGLNLINLYFKIIQPFYPVIDQQIFLEKYSRTHKEINPLLLVVLYLHALRYKHLDRDIQIDNSQVSKLENLMELYFLEALNYNNSTKFSNIQSFQLLLQYENFTKSKKLMNELVFVSEELGLNYKNLKIANWEYRIRLKLAWNLKVWDKLTSVLEFKSSKVNDINWNLKPLSQIEEDSSFFSCFIRLIKPLNRILSNLQNVSSYEEDAFPIVSIKYEQCLSTLNQWYQSFNGAITPKDQEYVNNSNSFISLKFLYYLLVFALDRRVSKSYAAMESVMSRDYNNLSNIDVMKYNSEILPGIKRHLFEFKTIFANEINQRLLSDTFWINRRIVITNTLISFFICSKYLGDTSLINEFYGLLQGFRSDYAVLVALKHVEKYYLEQ